MIFTKTITSSGQVIRTVEGADGVVSACRIRKSQETAHLSQIGAALKVIIHRELPGAMTCSTCREQINRLNRMTPEAVLADIDNIVADIFSRSETEAPKLWQKWAIKIDKTAHAALPATHRAAMKLVHGEIIDTTETERRIKLWVQEAVQTVQANIAPITKTLTQRDRCKRPVRRRNTQRRRGGFASAFHATGQPRFVTSAQLQQDILTLIGKLPADITAIAGVARSGLAVATMVSMYLHLPMLTIRQNSHDIMETGNGWRLGQFKHVSPKTSHICVIDDTCMTGNSLKAIRPLVEKLGRVTTATVYVNPLANVKPDIWAVGLGWPHLLEWNLFNSVLSPNMATDFDGILCRDCRPDEDDDGVNYLNFIRTAEPRYVIRRTEIPLIITARIEKYRQETMDWLQRHGMRVKRLVMHPADTLQQREQDNIAAFKAREVARWAESHYMQGPAPLGFIESEDWQAREIARLSRRMTICPGSGKVY